MELLTQKERELVVYLDSANDENESAKEQPAFLDGITDILSGLNEEYGKDALKQAMLDGVNAYEKAHGTKPPMSLISNALEQAKTYLDDVVDASATNMASEPRSLIPRTAIVAIQTTIGSAIPFAYYLSSENGSGEAPLIIVSHSAGSKTGQYVAGKALDGVGAGGTYITSDRTHKLSTSDQAAYTGKITPIMDSDETCEQGATAHPLYSGRTQILWNGQLVATASKGGATKDSFSSTFINASGTEITVTGSVTLASGDVTVNFSPNLETSDVVHARGYLNLEVESQGFTAPAIQTKAERHPMYASSYRVKVEATPEAKLQFEKELGIDPAFEGTLQARMVYAQELLYKTLHDACLIGKYNGLAKTYDLDYSAVKAGRTQASAVQELLTLISQTSQQMANKNGSHGVSHIYVGDKMRAIFDSLPDSLFVRSGLADKPTSYRLGRLLGRYEVYYSPKGLAEGADILLIGANPTNPAFNPFIMGDVSVPKVEPAGATTGSPNTGFWLTGKAFNQQNPVQQYATSCAIITVSNTSLG